MCLIILAPSLKRRAEFRRSLEFNDKLEALFSRIRKTPPVRSFIHSFIHSNIHSFKHLFIQTFIQTFKSARTSHAHPVRSFFGCANTRNPSLAKQRQAAPCENHIARKRSCDSASEIPSSSWRRSQFRQDLAEVVVSIHATHCLKRPAVRSSSQSGSLQSIDRVLWGGRSRGSKLLVAHPQLVVRPSSQSRAPLHSPFSKQQHQDYSLRPSGGVLKLLHFADPDSDSDSDSARSRFGTA